MKKMTALVRTESGNLTIKRYDDYKNQKEFSADLRCNGFRVLKIWSGYVNDSTVYDWEFANRK